MIHLCPQFVCYLFRFRLQLALFLLFYPQLVNTDISILSLNKRCNKLIFYGVSPCLIIPFYKTLNIYNI